MALRICLELTGRLRNFWRNFTCHCVCIGV